MTQKKRTPIIVLGSVLAMLLSAVVPTAASAIAPGEGSAGDEIVAPGASDVAPTEARETDPLPESNATADQELEPAPETSDASEPRDSDFGSATRAPAPSDETAAKQHAVPAPAAPLTYRVSGTIELPAGVAFTGTSVVLNNRASLKRWDAPGAFSKTAVLNPQTGAWSVAGIPAGEYRLWLPYQGHQLLPGKIVVSNADVAGHTTTLAATGQAVLGFFIPTGAQDGIERIAFRNLANGRETAVTEPLNGLGLASDPFVDLSAAGLCQAGGVGMMYWCPVLPPGNYTLRFELSNGKTVYYNGDTGANTSRPSVSGTTQAARATQLKVTTFTSFAAQHVDLSSHFTAPSGSNGLVFTDVPKSSKFAGDIAWLAKSGITTGVKQSNGTIKFLPKQSVTREAMIAFLYRANGVKNYQPKGASPFVDVTQGDQFYQQIMWAYENKVTTGIALGSGKRKFDPKATITREAMAAFMYRQYAQSIPAGSTATRFTDVPANHKFAKEIRWMASHKITTGVRQSDGTVRFLAKGATSREATAAFLHRAELKK
ncbi:S-layer family protein [Leucobacter luti]|uniref:S-layer homology domain-containing protein n=1 Tax=Leucobacter luti TaxID=340320 RepID=UPI0010E05FEE|nr:S-layer homology domain-containing protein [Leucobacter luti]MCW2288703.1 hypothetical protein [Leucobacter luti]TCK45142.1 S-layer family protein [Leucobacter luti]